MGIRSEWRRASRKPAQPVEGVQDGRLPLWEVARLVLVLMVGLAIGCQGGFSGRASSPPPVDAVHRIVESGILRVGMSGVQPPLNMKNRAGELIGFDVDVAEALADAMDLELELIQRPLPSSSPVWRRTSSIS